MTRTRKTIAIISGTIVLLIVLFFIVLNQLVRLEMVFRYSGCSGMREGSFIRIPFSRVSRRSKSLCGRRQ